MMFQHRQKRNPMLWSVRNAEFVERVNLRLGRDGLGVMEKIGKEIVITGQVSLPLHCTQSENKSYPVKDSVVLHSPSDTSFTIK